MGNNIHRNTKRDVLIADDLKKFLSDQNPNLTEEKITQIFDVSLVGSESDFATLHKVYGWMVDGVQFTPQNGLAKMILLIDFENPNKNIFRVVNQFTVEYTNNGQKENRRPDVILFVNGMPLCVIELKNPTDANATIYDAWEQINICYWRDIPHLRQELSARKSGGFYICTIQKFCNRQEDNNDRQNIVCFSDEAHRSQLEPQKRYNSVKILMKT